MKKLLICFLVILFSLQGFSQVLIETLEAYYKNNREREQMILTMFEERTKTKAETMKALPEIFIELNVLEESEAADFYLSQSKLLNDSSKEEARKYFSKLPIAVKPEIREKINQLNSKYELDFDKMYSSFMQTVLSAYLSEINKSHEQVYEILIANKDAIYQKVDVEIKYANWLSYYYLFNQYSRGFKNSYIKLQSEIADKNWKKTKSLYQKIMSLK